MIDKSKVDDRGLLFLCSGGGGNLRFIHRAVQEGWLPYWSRLAVIADRDCSAIEYARNASLANAYVDFTVNEQKNVLDVANSFKPDIIITTVHRILKNPILDAYSGRLINLHYSLLPAFGGTIGSRSVNAAIDYGAFFSGVTVHLVDETLDGGRPLVQIAVPVSHHDERAEFMNIIFRAGCIALYIALNTIVDHSKSASWIGGSFVIHDREVLINPVIDLPTAMSEEVFWESLKR